MADDYKYEDHELVYEEFEVEHNGDMVWNDTLTEEEFGLVVRAMGWHNEADFTNETGCDYSDIKGQYWMVIGSANCGTSLYIM